MQQALGHACSTSLSMARHAYTFQCRVNTEPIVGGGRRLVKQQHAAPQAAIALTAFPIHTMDSTRITYSVQSQAYNPCKVASPLGSSSTICNSCTDPHKDALPSAYNETSAVQPAGEIHTVTASSNNAWSGWRTSHQRTLVISSNMHAQQGPGFQHVHLVTAQSVMHNNKELPTRNRTRRTHAPNYAAVQQQSKEALHKTSKQRAWPRARRTAALQAMHSCIAAVWRDEMLR